jgi:aminoglycoside phosphotransferase (APT) family kinase protein
MHHDEIDSDSDLVRRLLREQGPKWADLPIEPVSSTGTDNALYRLGDHMVVRLPLRPSSVDLAGFIAALQSLDPTGGPKPSIANFWRGVPLSQRDRDTPRAISASHDLIDTAAVTAAWKEALRVPAWD